MFDCILRGIYRSIKLFLKVGDLNGISGHNFVEEGVYENCKVTVLKCKDCGEISIGFEIQ